MSAEELFGQKAPDVEQAIAAVNEHLIAEQVRAGNMPPAVLDHIGHKKFNIYNPGCEFCAAGR